MRPNKSFDTDAELASLSLTLRTKRRQWSMAKRKVPAKIKKYSLEFKAQGRSSA